MSDPRSLRIFHGNLSGRSAASDTVGPFLTSYPRDGHGADAPLVFVFDEAIKLGAGTISLFNNSDQGITETLAGNPYVTVSGNTLSYDPPQRMAYVTWYTVALSFDAVTDLAGNRANGGYSWSQMFRSGLVPDAQNLTGTADADVMHGSDLADTMNGLGGSDRIHGYGGDDILRGGDEVAGQFNTSGDTIDGGDGNDILYGEGGADTLSGGDGDDRLYGGDDDDRLHGNDGDDQLDGGAGKDFLYGGAGSNILLGGAGDDELSVEYQGGGILDGGDGNDRLSGYLGADYIGGSGDDQIEIRLAGPAPGPTTASGGDGNDILLARFGGTQAAVTLSGGAGSDTFVIVTDGIAIGTGMLTITDFTAGAGGDRIDLLGVYPVQADGNPFTNGVLRLLAAGGNTLVQLRESGNPSVYATLLTLTGVQPEQLTGANFAGGIDPRGGTTGVTLTGTAGTDLLTGTFLDDKLYGLGGSDTLNGNGGDDLLEGGDGNDFLNGAAGDNILRGGDGDDRLTSSMFGTNLMEGGAGKDYLTGGAGNDRMLGGAGDDILQLDSSFGTTPRLVTMAGEDGNDILRTGSADKSVKVTASGGAGADTFVISSFADLTILDFSQGDLLDLRPLHSHLIMSGNPFGAAGFLKAEQDGARVQIYADNDGAAGTAQTFQLAVTLENVQLSALGSAAFAGGYDPSGTSQGMTLRGTAGADQLTGGALDDIIEGFDGNDTIDGGAGNDRLYGGDESIVGGGDALRGGFGNDELFGGSGNDNLHGGEGDDLLYGGSGDDSLDGGIGANRLDGGDGRDTLYSSSGSDTVLGGAGDDTLSGGGYGADGPAATIFDGGDGDDRITARGGVQTVLGGAGDDEVRIEAEGGAQNSAAMVVDMGSGNDQLMVAAVYYLMRPIQASGGAGVDIYSFIGSERWPLLTITDFQTGAGGDVVDLHSLSYTFTGNPFGAAGQARLVQDGSRVLLQLDLDGPAGAGAWDTRIVFENTRTGDFSGANFSEGARPDGASNGQDIAGTTGNDTLQGGRLDDTIRAGAGNDLLQGAAGNDKLYGEAGNDSLDGDEGNDLLDGGDGDDSLYGGLGNDELLGGAGKDTLQDNAGDNVLRGGDGDDTLIATTGGFNQVFGEAGNDLITSQGGDGLLDGGAGDDYISITGHSYDGRSARIEAFGGDGSDTFNIVLYAGRVASTLLLSGGSGSDTFHPLTMANGSTVTITDFTAGNGGDLIDVSNIAIPTAGNPFGASLQLVQRGADSVLQARPGRDAGAAFQDVLVLRNVDKASLTSQNFSNGFHPDGSTTGMTRTGLDGPDRFDGGWFDDTLRGGAGDDVLNGWMGNDRLEGGDGDDLLDGDKLGAPPAGGSPAQWPTLFTGDDLLDGGAGNDTLTSSYGADTLLGGAGNDLLVLARAPYVFGAPAASYRVTLDGGEGSDRIAIQDGVAPGVGATMRGGGGSDTFQLNVPAPSASYVIADFQAGAGGDVLDVFELLGWVRQSPFATGHVILEQRGADTMLRIDADGAAGARPAADLVTLSGVAKEALTSANFRYGHAPEGSAAVLAPEVRGGAGGERLTGDARADLLYGEGGNDVLAGHGGNDLLDGGAGTDTAVYGGARGQFQLSGFGNDSLVVSDRRAGAGDGKDSLASIERLLFTDGAIALDTGDGAAGQAYRIYRAAFDREPDQVGLGFWIEMLDRGVTLQAVAGGFTRGEEFAALYGANPSNAEIVTRLYRNILDREPEQGGYDFWLSVLDDKLTDLGTVLAAFSESPENREAVAELIARGVDFQPFPG